MNSLFSLLYLGLLTLAAFGLGKRATRALGLNCNSLAEELSFAVTVGFGMLSYATWTIGLLGLLYRVVSYVILVLAILIGFGEIKALVCRVKGAMNSSGLWDILRFRRGGFPSPERCILMALMGIFLIDLSMYVISSLAPPFYADSLGYHLAAPKAYIRIRRISFIPIWTWNFPFTPQMLYMLSMLLWSDRLATLVSLTLGTLTALGVFALGQQHLKLTDHGALLGGLLFYATPLITLSITTPQEDAGLALFTLMALYAVANWLDAERGEWLAVSGMMAGWAAGSKYTALLLPVFLGLFVFIRSWRRYSFPGAFRNLLIFGLVSLAVGCPWYLKNWVATGNPIWPQMYQVLGGRYWSEAASKAYADNIDLQSLSLAELERFVRGPWDYTVNLFPRSRDLLSPLYLALLPALILVWPERRGIRRVFLLILSYIFVFYLGWFITNRNLSYFSAITALLAVMTAYVVECLNSIGRWWQIVVWGVIGADLLFCLVGGVIYTTKALPVVFGLESEKTFLEKSAGFYPVMRYANENLPLDSKLFVFPRHTYYLDRDYLRASTYMQAIVNYAELDTEDKLLARLKELGFTHIIWDSGYGRSSDKLLARTIGEEGRIERQLHALERRGDLTVIFHDNIQFPTSRVLSQRVNVGVVIYEIR